MRNHRLVILCRACLVVVATCVPACAIASVPSPEGAGTAGSGPGEHEVFKSIWGAADDDIWALGELANFEIQTIAGSLPCTAGTPPVLVGSILRHFDGSEWSRSDVTTEGLLDLHGSDRDNVWAVGIQTILRWDGARWIEQDIVEATRHDPPQTCIEEATLSSVWALSPEDVWAVGFISRDNLPPGLILHFDGQRWIRHVVEAQDTFLSVWASSPADVWTVGASGIAFHFDGSAWRRVDVDTDEYLFSVWGSGPNDVWVAGNAGTLLHFDGERWQAHAATASASRALRALSGRSKDDISSVSEASTKDDGPAQQIDHWDGERWASSPISSAEHIADLWTSPSGQLWSAGSRIARRR